MQGAYVTLVPTPKSHMFEERRIKVGPESDPVKIGRAVARIQPTSENAVFDCKVLSRNHAVLWYKDGNFFLRDTKSSNGTFVNNEKLQINSKENDTKQVFSGDIIQFGVEIIENTNKVAYGCIYAVIQCYNHEGKSVEMFHPGIDDSIKSNETLVSNRKLFKMQQYVAEATYREKIRNDKIMELMSIIEANEQAAETAWKALVNEDRLLARIEALEAQLSVYSNNNHPDKQQESLLAMIDEKTKFEAMTKEMIRRLQEEVGETASRLKDMERSLDTTETTCQQLNSANADLENILAETTEMYDQKVQEVDAIVSSAQETQKSLMACEEKLASVQEKYLKLMITKSKENNFGELIQKLIEVLNEDDEIEVEKINQLIEVLKNRQFINEKEVEEEEAEEKNIIKLKNEAGNVSDDDSRKSNLDKSVESYLKEILSLQAKNRDLEYELTRVKETFKLVEEEDEEKKLDSFTEFCQIENIGKEKKLEISPTKNISFEPFLNELNKQKIVDQMAQMFFLVSFVPFFALLLTILLPIHNKLFRSTKTIEADQENNKKIK